VRVDVPGTEGARRFDLGRSLDAGKRVLALNLSEPLTTGHARLDTMAGTFARDGDGRLVRTSVVTWGRVVPNTQSAWVAFCIPHGKRGDIPPGAYSGQIHLIDSRLVATSVPLSFTVSYPQPWRVFGVGLLICIAATVYTYSLRRRDLPQRASHASEDMFRLKDGFWAGYGSWISGLPAVLTVASGLLAASAAFSAQYLDSQGWGDSSKDWITFAGAVGTAFIAGASTGKFVQSMGLRENDAGGQR
jgi:hypothetical protein